MKASVGDRIVIASGRVDTPVRDGEVVELRHPDGSPPYVVRWSDGSQGLFFPGPDATVHHPQDVQKAPEPTTGRAKTWTVEVQVFEAEDGTSAHAVLRGEKLGDLSATGETRRNPRDSDVPEIGDEVAVARALRRLADRLLHTAEADIEAREGHKVHLHA